MSKEGASFKVAAVQMMATNSKEANLGKAERFVARAAQQGARVVALPEMFSFSGSVNEKKENAEPIPGPTIDRLRELARKLGIYILCGSILEGSCGGRESLYYNTSVYLGPEGNIIARYRKLHLFDVTLPGGSRRQESELISPGDEVVYVTTPEGVFGLSICYDVRFPELYRRLAERGVQIVFIPSAFTFETGKDHWKTLLRARAIENQFYVIAPDQIGKDPMGRRCWGKSMIVDPWGTVLTEAAEKETVIFADIDLGYEERLRRDLPFLSHMREDLS